MTGQNQQNSLLGKIAAYTEILAKDPGSTIFVSLSEAYRKTGMLDDARQVIENGLERHPDFSPAHIVYARILCQQGEYDASSDAFQKALMFDQESLAALVGYARLHILLGQESKARALLLDARDLSPADPVINKLLLSLPEPEPAKQEDSGVEEAAGSVDEITEAEEDADDDDGGGAAVPPLASSTLADLYLQQGLTEQALDMYRQLSADNPDNLEYRRKIRDIEGESDESSIASAFDNVQGEQSVVEPVEEVAMDGDVAVATASTITVDKAGDEKVLETLNRWLDSIKKRREDV